MKKNIAVIMMVMGLFLVGGRREVRAALGDLSLWGKAGDNIYSKNSGSIGVGTSSPGNYKLNVQGGMNTAVYGQSSLSYGVYGVSTDSHGVFGTSTAAYGVYGYVNSNPAVGVYGRNAAGGKGVVGYSESGTAGSFYSNSGYGLIIEKGKVGIGTKNPRDSLEIVGNVRLNGGFNKPGCGDYARGVIWFGVGSSGDALEICMLDKSGQYQWKSLVD